MATCVHRFHVCHVLSKNCSRTEMKSELHPASGLAPPSGPYGEGCGQQELPWEQRGVGLADLLSYMATLLVLHVGV